MNKFPYLRNFLDAKSLWRNIIRNDYIEIVRLDPELVRKFRGDFWNPEEQYGYHVSKSNRFEEADQLVDYFSEYARVKSYRKERLSTLEFYHQNKSKVVSVAKKLKKENPNKHWMKLLNDAIYDIHKAPNVFFITNAKALYKFFNSRRVLDPSAGWGDRLLGAAAAGVETYHGVDPNTDMAKAYQEMLDFVKRPNYQVDIEDFLEAKINQTYDTILTSPPFFDLEIYSDDEKQSIQNRETPEKWTNEFLIPYVNKAWSYLESGGHMILYIVDIRGSDYITPIMEELESLGAISQTPIAGRRPWAGMASPIFVWRKS